MLRERGGRTLSRKRHNPKEVVPKLRQVDVFAGTVGGRRNIDFASSGSPVLFSSIAPTKRST
jgi:hypothetical protein